jgi:Tfp pilus assembly protein PilN
MSTLTTTRVEAPVRVNLLPPEIEQARKLRHLKAALAGSVVVAAAAVGVLYWQAASDVNAAQDELASAKAENVTLQHQAAQYASVPVVYAQVQAAQAQLGQVERNEVHWSTYLTDLSLKMPPRVWLTSMQIAQTYPIGAPGAKASGDPLAPAGTVGTITFNGYAMRHQDVAVWLDSLAKLTDGTYPYFTQSTDAKIGDTDVVQVASTVLVKDSALVKAGAAQKAGN